MYMYIALEQQQARFIDEENGEEGDKAFGNGSDNNGEVEGNDEGVFDDNGDEYDELTLIQSLLKKSWYWVCLSEHKIGSLKLYILDKRHLVLTPPWRWRCWRRLCTKSRDGGSTRSNLYRNRWCWRNWKSIYWCIWKPIMVWFGNNYLCSRWKWRKFRKHKQYSC